MVGKMYKLTEGENVKFHPDYVGKVFKVVNATLDGVKIMIDGITSWLSWKEFEPSFVKGEVYKEVSLYEESKG